MKKIIENIPITIGDAYGLTLETNSKKDKYVEVNASLNTETGEVKFYIVKEDIKKFNNK